MGIMMPETCWDRISVNKLSLLATSCWFCLSVPVLCFVFGLMMAQWAETCRRIFNCEYWLPVYVVFIDWLNYYVIAKKKRGGMAPIKIKMFQSTALAFTIIFPTHSTPYNFRSWKAVVKIIINQRRNTNYAGEICHFVGVVKKAWDFCTSLLSDWEFGGIQ
jgi:hypothetical protein